MIKVHNQTVLKKHKPSPREASEDIQAGKRAE